MALLPQPGSSKKRAQIVAIDLGRRSTKAVSIQRRGTSFELLRYTIQDAPIQEKGLSPELMAEHLKTVFDALGAKTRQVTLVVGVHYTLVRHAEVPFVPVEDMRLMLKFNSKNYLQQELPDHVFDCHISHLAPAPNLPSNPAKTLNARCSSVERKSNSSSSCKR